MTDTEFDQAAKDIKDLKTRPTDEELLEIYALFKQATEGDCNTSRPGMFDLKGKAKWDAWNSKKGMSKDEAKRNYVTRSVSLVETYGKN